VSTTKSIVHPLDKLYAELSKVFENDASARACLHFAQAYGRSERDLLVELVRVLADEKRVHVEARVRHAEVCAQPIRFCANPSCVAAKEPTP